MVEKIKDYKYALDESSIIAITDKRGIILHVNDNFCAISKYSREELIGQDHRIINSGYHPKPYIKNLWSTISSGKVWKGELKNKAKDGSTYWVDTAIVPFLDDENTPYQYIAIRSDITERKRIEQELRDRKNIAIDYAQVLEQKNSQLIDFISIVSHNFRAPLVNLSMLMDFMEESNDTLNLSETVSKSRIVIDHLMDVCNELVEALQVKVDIHVEPDIIFIKDCLDKVLKGFVAQIEKSEATILVDVSQVESIRFPKKYLESVFSNLLSNALKYYDPNRKPIITIKAFKKGNDSVVMTFADNGLGIDLELHKDQIFKIRKTFHKHADARGFGLFLTKNQIEALGGSIWVESTPNKSSTFYIEFKNQNI